jgi:type II secretory pathway pseudopilin PulG
MVTLSCSESGGFTLVEILVALFVMIIGISSAFALFASATAMHKRATDQTTVAMMAESILSEVENRLTAGTPIEAIARADATFSGYQDYRYDLELQPIDEEGCEVFVRLGIRWLKQGRERNQEFTTILLRHIPFKGREPYIPDGD